jgi:hypothetical protein
MGRGVAVAADDANELGGIAVDGSGNVVLAGDYYGALNIGSYQLTALGGRDTFVAKLAGADGSAMWAHTYGATRFDTNDIDDGATSIAVGPNDSMVVGGFFSGTLTFGALSLTASSSGDSTDGYIAEFDAAGVAHWARNFDDVSLDIVNNVAFDANGDVYATGRSWATIDFGLGAITPPPGSYNDMYLAKLSGADGTTKWGNVFSGAGDDIATAVAIGADQDPVIVGTTYIGANGNGADFGSGAISGTPGTNLAVAKFAGTNGANMWAKVYGGAAGVSANDVAVDSAGDIVVSGGFWGTLNVGGGAMTTATTHLVLFELAHTGTFNWSANSSGGMSNGASVTFGTDGRAELAGLFSGTVNFGLGALTSTPGVNGGTPTNIFVFAR